MTSIVGSFFTAVFIYLIPCVCLAGTAVLGAVALIVALRGQDRPQHDVFDVDEGEGIYWL